MLCYLFIVFYILYKFSKISLTNSKKFYKILKCKRIKRISGDENNHIDDQFLLYLLNLLVSMTLLLIFVFYYYHTRSIINPKYCMEKILRTNVRVSCNTRCGNTFSSFVGLVVKIWPHNFRSWDQIPLGALLGKISFTIPLPPKSLTYKPNWLYLCEVLVQ